MTIIETAPTHGDLIVDGTITGVDTIAVDTTNGDHDRFQHYFHKKQIENNIFNGTPMKALCGKIVKQQVDPKGRTVCQSCQDILDREFPDE